MKIKIILLLGVLILCKLDTFAQINLATISGKYDAQTDTANVKNVFDNNISSFYSVNQNSVWLIYKAYSPFLIGSYSIISSTNSASEDPQSWILEGSTDLTNWVQLDSKTGQTFASRNESKKITLTHTVKYRYYRLKLSTTNTKISIAEWGLFLPACWDTFKMPTNITIKTKGSGTTSGEQIFLNNVDKPLAQHICLGVNQFLYTCASEVPAFDKLTLSVDPNDNGVAGKSGDPVNGIEVGFGGPYLSSSVTQNGIDKTMEELRGILYHEITHAYTKEPLNAGAYTDGTNFHTYIEGIADYVRYNAGYISISRRQPEQYWWGYNPAAFFIDWMVKTKDPLFATKFVKTADTLNYWTWNKATNLILGRHVMSLWTEYQAFLLNQQNTSAIVSSFYADKTLAKTGESVTFENFSYNATSYEWTFEGGSPATSTAFAPSVTYSQPGIYNVTLKAIGSSGNKITLKEGFIVVGLYNVTGSVLSAQNPNSGSSENLSNIKDETPLKYLAPAASNWIQMNLGVANAVYGFTVTSANDFTERDPKSIKFLGSNDGTNWVTLYENTNVTFSDRFQKKIFLLPSPQTTQEYTYFRVEMIHAASDYYGDNLQISEMEVWARKSTFQIDITDLQGPISDQYNSNTIGRAIDNSSEYYQTGNQSTWIKYDAKSKYILKSYRITAAKEGDLKQNPATWTLAGSNDNVSFVTIDQKSSQSFTAFSESKEISLASNTTAYRYYRLTMTSTYVQTFLIFNFYDTRLGELELFGFPETPTFNQTEVSLGDLTVRFSGDESTGFQFKSGINSSITAISELVQGSGSATTSYPAYVQADNVSVGVWNSFSVPNSTTAATGKMAITVNNRDVFSSTVVLHKSNAVYRVFATSNPLLQDASPASFNIFIERLQ